MMKLNTLLIMTMVALTATAASAEEASSTSEKQQKKSKMMNVNVKGQGNMYNSDVDFDLNDPNVIVTIETDETDETEDSMFDEKKANKLHSKAQKLARTGRYQEALTLLKEAETLTENPAKILSLQGSALYKLNRIDSAKDAWNESLRHDSKQPEIKRMLSWLEKEKS
tara:strand:- start:3489 stop:3992 length:504 start_codon:yes stop_codon:yes gene_type:complete